MDVDCSKQFTHVPCSRCITNGRWLFKEFQSYFLFKMDDDCSKNFSHIPCSRQTTNERRLSKAVQLYPLFKMDNKWAMTLQSSSNIFLVQDNRQMDYDCPKEFNYIPCSRQIANGRWLSKEVQSHSLFKTINKWTMTVQSSSNIFLVQDNRQMEYDCPKKFNYIPCSRQITNGRWLFTAVHSYSLFKIDNKWTMDVQTSSLISRVRAKLQRSSNLSKVFRSHSLD